MKKYIFVIEHLEPKLWPWCIIEYKHISKIVGKKDLFFTNIKKRDKNKLVEYGRIINKSIKSLRLKNACILDPESPNTLTPEKSNKFEYFIFGGILGDYPPRKRTKQELTKFIKNIPSYNIGKEQMSTDNAVFVTKQIIKGKSLRNIKFQDTIEININKIESTILPYRYALMNKKPLISKELIKFIKKKDNSQ